MTTPYTLRNPLKNGQFILAIDAQFFRDRDFANGIHDFPLYDLYNAVQPYLTIRQRAALEENLAYRQILPYKVITQLGADGRQRIVGYRRLKAGGESRLYGLMSIGFGGHIDLEDVVTCEGEPDSPERSTVDLEATVRASSRRELGQEVHCITASGGAIRYEPAIEEVVPANTFIHYSLVDALGPEWTPKQDVHSFHVAFVYNIEADPRLEFTSGEPNQIELLAPMTAEELLVSGMPMEEWTRLLLEHMVANRARIEASHANLLGA